MKRRIVIIGLDGVPFEMFRDLSGTGVMPNAGRVVREGTFKRMQSSIPDVSCVAWSSIITGKNPAEHGIFGFTDLSRGTYNLRFPNFNDLKSPPFWDLIEGKSVIVNVPSTYPVREMNGVHISGFVSIELEKSVYPESLIARLKEMDYRLDVDSRKAHESMDLFLSDLDKVLEAQIKTYRYLWENFEWQVFMLVFTGTDRLMHFLWEAYEDKNHKYHRDFMAHFQKIDEVIGEINARVNEDDIVLILSDHGFEKLNKDVYISYFLKKEGFLKFKDDKQELSNIDYPAKAFVLDPARIYINIKGKYPCGGVDKQDREGIIKRLEDLFSSLEIDNKKVIRNIYRKEEIYSGPFLEQAPDLILMGNEGFNLKANLKADKPIDRAIFTGKHTQENAFLLLKGFLDKGIMPEFPTVCHVKGLIEKSGIFAGRQ